MARLLNALSLVGFLTVLASAQPDLSSPVPIDPTVRVGKLPNGLKYYIKKNARPENKVELRLVVNAGSILERDDQQGVAHFLEHMAFNGTKSFRKNDLISYLQTIGVQFGADLNARTTFDETVYILPIPTDKAEYLDTGLQILTEWASDIALDPAEIERERGVILEELRLGNGADRRMLDRYFRKIFASSKYADRFAIGKKQIIETVIPQTIVDFYEDWYRPDLMAVVAVGNLDVADMERKIAEKFSSIKPKRPSKLRPEFKVPDHKQTIMAVETDKEAQATIVQMLFKKPVVAVKTKRDYRREIVKSIFNGMLDMRLKNHMLSEDPAFMLVGSSFTPFVRNKAVYSMFGIVDPKNVRTALSVLFKESRRARELGFQDSELESVKDFQLAMDENRFRDRNKIESSALASEFVDNFLLKKPIAGADFDYEFSKKIIPTITLAEINALAKETLANTNRAIVVSGEDRNGITFPTEVEIASLINTADKTDLNQIIDSVALDEKVSEISIAGSKTEKKEDQESKPIAKVIEESTDSTFGTTYLKLSNGVRVALRSDPKVDGVVMKAFSPGGLSLVDNTRSSREFIAAIDGEGGLSSQAEVFSKSAGKAVGVSVGIDDSYEYVYGRAPAKGVESMLKQVSHKFMASRLEKSTLDTYTRILKTLPPDSSANPLRFFEQQVYQVMTQGSPLARRIPNGEQLDQISLDDVNAIYKERFGDASDFTFIFAGNFDADAMRTLLLQHLGSLPTTNRMEKGRDPGIRPPSGKLDRIFRKGIGQQSYVRLMFTDEAKYDSVDDTLLDFLDDLLLIKLFEVLREERSGVYTVNAKGKMFTVPYERFEFTVEFPCGPENVGSLIDATLGEIAKIQDGQIVENDLNKVKASLLRKAKEDATRGDYWSNEIMLSLRDGTAMSSQAEIEKRINSVTKDDIVRVAKKYLKIDQRKQFVLMPEKGNS